MYFFLFIFFFWIRKSKKYFSKCIHCMFIQKVSLLLKFILVQCQSICASQTRTFSWAFRTFFSDEAFT